MCHVCIIYYWSTLMHHPMYNTSHINYCLSVLQYSLMPSSYSSGVLSGEGFKPPRNSEVLTKLSQIPSSMEYTSVTTLLEYGFHSFANWVEPLTRGLPPPDPFLSALCPQLNMLNPPSPPKKIPCVNPHPPLEKNSWVHHCHVAQFNCKFFKTHPAV
jgi:hypothetical protein